MPNTKLKTRTLHSEMLPIPGSDPWHVCETDSALLAMTDFRTRSSVTVPENDNLDDALLHMKYAGVRCALVTDKDKKGVVGMITAYDIMGEKPQQYMRHTGAALGDVQVKDIMQKISGWRVVNISDIEHSTVADVLKIFKDTGVTHMPVVETTEEHDQRLRGLLSFANVRRLLAT
jgi:CBS domain containing-hemolysin-like protein